MNPREKSIDPRDLDLEAEHRYIQSNTRQVRRIQMQRGDSWLVRFLPAEMGPKKHWYARIARHWINKKPTVCPRHTGPDYGGDPDAYCAICDEVASLNSSDSDPVRDAAFQGRANAQWLTYCLVIEKSSGHGSVTATDSELVLPYTFELYKTTFEELMSFYRHSSRKNNRLSVLDLVRGCDFWASKGKGIRLDRVEPAPILNDLPEDPMSDPRIIKIMEQLHTPRVVIPSTEKLEEAADKLRDFALRGPRESRGGGGGRRGGRSRSEDADYESSEHEGRGGHDEEDAPPPRTRGRAPRAEEEEQDDIPGAESPRRREDDQEPQTRRQPAREQPAPQRTSAKAQEPVSQDPETDEAAHNEVDDDDQEDSTVHRSVTRVPAPSQRAAQPPPRPPERRMSPSASAATASRAARPKDGSARIDESEEVPEERTDKAPPSTRPVQDVNDPPPPVNRSGAAAATPERIKARVTAARQGRASE